MFDEVMVSVVTGEVSPLVAGIAFLTMMPEWGRSVVFLRWANDVVVVGLLVALTTRRVDLSRVAVLVGVMFALTAPVWASIA